MNAKPVTKPENDIIDLDLSQTARKTIRFDGDNNRIVRINTSDMGIVKRFEEAVKELQDLQGESVKILENSINDEEKDDMTALTEFGTALADIDQKMRDLIDKIFDAPVSAAAAPDGTMYDPFNGSWRYEYIIECIMLHCADNLVAEFKKMEQQLKKHTQKYTKGKKK